MRRRAVLILSSSIAGRSGALNSRAGESKISGTVNFILHLSFWLYLFPPPGAKILTTVPTALLVIITCSPILGLSHQRLNSQFNRTGCGLFLWNVSWHNAPALLTRAASVSTTEIPVIHLRSYGVRSPLAVNMPTLSKGHRFKHTLCYYAIYFRRISRQYMAMEDKRETLNNERLGMELLASIIQSQRADRIRSDQTGIE